VSPELVVTLANLTVARRPGRGPTVHPDPLVTTDAAAGALGVARVAEPDLVALVELHRVVVDLVDRLLDDRDAEPPAARLTALARPSRARAELELTEDGDLIERLEWTDSTLTAGLARRVILELGAMDVGRLRRCGRPECDLVFYDTTRSNTRRWHAESPCGQRERQRRHRGDRVA
jgi:predicted RNA-binding Zn ribbon-like protein